MGTGSQIQHWEKEIMKVNYDSFLKLVQGLVDKINSESEKKNYEGMLSAAFAFRELLVMEARNLDESVCKPVHAKVMQDLLQPTSIITPPNSLLVPGN
jgi:hypothetical protein